MDARQIVPIRRLFPCFSEVPEHRWNTAELLSVSPSTPHSIREGHLLQHAMFVVSGGIRVFKICPSTGRELTLYRVYGGQCCALMIASVLGETEYDASVSIEEQSEVLLLPIPTFKDWVEAYRPIKQFVYKQIMGRVTDVAKLLERVAFRSIPYRLADYLLSQAQFAQNNVIRLTHEQLSIEIGTAREVLGRTLKNFADLGAIALGRGQINLLDRDTLREIAERHL